MKVARLDVTDQQLADPRFDGWRGLERREFVMVPTPLNGNPGIRKISPFIEKSTDHGSVTALAVACAHNGSLFAVNLSWASARHDRMVDLDEFVDGAAVMFPLTARASAVTMGSETDPVNAWYWKANLEDAAFDVVAYGYGTSGRSRDAHLPVSHGAHHDGSRWNLVLSRKLGEAVGRVGLDPGGNTRMAFAVWDGGNRERSGRKSFSGDFVPASIER